MIAKDLIWIKKHYGEKMMHLCRDLFPSLLDTDGLVPQLLEDHFPTNHDLALDIISQNAIDEFKGYMYSFVVPNKKEQDLQDALSANELLDKAGYILYPECKTEEEIQSFKKYYTPNEALCTFRGGRLDTCRVWFAVKKNVDELKRKDFTKPSRQDEYGTSVISIQFTRGENCTLSIKNRYNHSVVNPDNTFNNNLENIIEGLSDAFYRDYGVRGGRFTAKDFELDNYVFVDGKYYKYDYSIDDVYYCGNNTIIYDNAVCKLADHQMLVDRFIFDFKEKTVKSPIDDGGFIDTVKNLEQIIHKDNKLTLTRSDGSVVELGLDDKRRVVSLTDNGLTRCDDDYLRDWKYLQNINLPELKQCGRGCFVCNDKLKSVHAPKLIECGSFCFSQNESLKEVYTPQLSACGSVCFTFNYNLTTVNLNSLKHCGISFFTDNHAIEELSLDKLEYCEGGCFSNNKKLKLLKLPVLQNCCCDCFCNNNSIEKLEFESLQSCGDYSFCNNKSLIEASMPQLYSCGSKCFSNNESLEKLRLDALYDCWDANFENNPKLKDIELPNLNYYDAEMK